LGRLAALAFLSVLFVFADCANASVDDVFAGAGYDGDGVQMVRIGLRDNFDGALFESRLGRLSGNLEAALLHWWRDGEAVNGLALAPTVAYYFGRGSASLTPFVGGGIGVSYLSGTEFDGRYLSTRFQFEDRLGVGIIWGRASAYVAYAHYSNASIAEPNDGLDEIILTIGWSLQ